jgi:hypothetical protein
MVQVSNPYKTDSSASLLVNQAIDWPGTYV